MNRRAFTAAFAKAGVATLLLATLGTHSWAQRPTNPIYRPRPGRPGGALARGRLSGSTGGVAGGVMPGVFTVRGVDADRNSLRIADDDGKAADVAVAPHVFDLSQLQPGDEVEVDFIVPDGGGKPLAAAAVWKLERVSP
ncbi:hypothetical protein ACVNIS_16750 [Sphaerotilaceae bacterium SBD11-9]